MEKQGECWRCGGTGRWYGAADCSGDKQWNTCFDCHKHLEVTEKAEKAQSPWIDVKGSLPDVGTPVLVLFRDEKVVCIAKRCRVDRSARWRWHELLGSTLLSTRMKMNMWEIFDEDALPTHWLPIPEAPKS